MKKIYRVKDFPLFKGRSLGCPKMKMALSLFLSIWMGISNYANAFPDNGTSSPDLVAQQAKNTVTGNVKDENGAGLVGVSIIEKGTTNGTVSDIDGNYKVNVAANSILVFSSVGYVSKEVEVNSQSVIDLTMNPDVQQLQELVVVGYGTVKKKDLTGAVGVIEGKAIADRHTTQVSQALQGAIPGIMVTRDNSAPGATASIRIRGITTIGDSNPLIIVDGVPVDNINDVNPNDIESISVLKDAASASIYGSRAAAGVILVTTKRAKAGQANFTYNVEYGAEKPTKLPDYADPVRYMQMSNELRWNDNGNSGDEYPTYKQDVVDNYYSLNKDNPDLYPITDWKSVIFKSSAPRQSHDFSFTVGGKNIRTLASINYDKVGGIYDDLTYERFTARINNDLTINKFLSATIDLNLKRSISKQPVVNPIYRARMSAPIYAALWNDGRVAEGKAGANIYGQMEYGGFNNDWYNQLGGKVSLDITPFDGLKISGVLSPTFGYDKGKEFKKQIAWYQWDDPSAFGGYLEGASSTRLNEVRNDNIRVTAQLLVNYDKSFGDHNLGLLAGYEDYHATYEDLGAGRDQYVLSSFPYLDLGPLDYRDNSGSAYENAYRSYFGRVMYNYKNKYFVQANVRYDGSSRFQENYRWGSFPSLSAGWVISEEPFMKDISGLSFLKLRGSYGTLGNERIGNYPYQATIAFSNALFYMGNDIVSAQTAAQTKYAISDISWETTNSYDFGIDANFLDDRLRFTGDYYKKTTKDMLLALEIPDYIGFDNPDQNTGKMFTNGWEAVLGWNDHVGDFGYSVSFNMSDFKSVMGDLGGTEFLGDQIKVQGSQFNEWYGYKTDGLFQTQEEVDNSPVLNTAVKPGDVKLMDISGPEGKPDGLISPEYDRVPLGGSLPRYLYGGNIQLNYKGFDFSVYFQGVGKQNARLQSVMVRPFLENWGNVPSIIDGNYWSKYNTDEQNMSVGYPRLSDKSGGNNYAMSDYWLFNGSYFRLKNITLGYNIPESAMEKFAVKGIRVYASASDLFSLDHYPKGWDPESSTSNYISASYILGLSVKF